MTLPTSFGPQFAHGAGSYNGTPDMRTAAPADMHPMTSMPPYSPSFIANADIPPSLSSANIPVHDSAPSQQDHISYYFEHVRRLQFVFAGNALTDTLYYVREASIEAVHSLLYSIVSLTE